MRLLPIVRTESREVLPHPHKATGAAEIFEIELSISRSPSLKFELRLSVLQPTHVLALLAKELLGNSRPMWTGSEFFMLKETALAIHKEFCTQAQRKIPR